MLLKTFITYKPTDPDEFEPLIEGVEFEGDKGQIGVQIKVSYLTSITLESKDFDVNMAELKGYGPTSYGEGKLKDSFTMDITEMAFLGSIVTVKITWHTAAFPEIMYYITSCKVEFNNYLFCRKFSK